MLAVIKSFGVKAELSADPGGECLILPIIRVGMVDVWGLVLELRGWYWEFSCHGPLYIIYYTLYILCMYKHM